MNGISFQPPPQAWWARRAEGLCKGLWTAQWLPRNWEKEGAQSSSLGPNERTHELHQDSQTAPQSHSCQCPPRHQHPADPGFPGHDSRGRTCQAQHRPHHGTDGLSIILIPSELSSLLLRKLKHREGWGVGQGHTARKQTAKTPSEADHQKPLEEPVPGRHGGPQGHSPGFCG